MSNLKSTLESLANDFARSIISALRTASLDELSGVTGFDRPAASGRSPRPAVSAPSAPATGGAQPAARKRGRAGRLGRRSTSEIGQMVEDIVSLLEKTPEGLRAEQIREALNVQAKELPRPLADGLSEGRISKSGQKRATTYFAGGEGGAKRRGPGRRKRA